MTQPRDTPVRVGHKGAGRLAAPNSLAGLHAAPAARLDVVELDVVRRPADGRLVLAYSPLQAALTARATLADALALLAGAGPLSALRVALDLKQAGTEAEVAAALRAHGLIDRALVTARRPRALRRVRTADPAVRLGWSLGRSWHARMVGERDVPAAITRAAADGLCEAVMLHHPLVTRAAVGAAAEAGLAVFAWTVNSPARVAALTALGVTGIVTDEPRLLAAPVPAATAR